MNQIKTVFILFLGFFSFSTLIAQVQIGAKAGIGGSNITKLDLDSKTRVGFVGGLVAKIQLDSRYSGSYNHYIQPELIYSNQGEYNAKYKRFINYLSVPIMYQYYFSDSDKDIFLELGPQVSYIVSDKLEGFIERYDNPQTGSQNQKVKNTDLALNFGIGYSNIRKYEVNVRYQFGLTDIVDGVHFDNGFNRTSLISMTFTYFFNSFR